MRSEICTILIQIEEWRKSLRGASWHLGFEGGKRRQCDITKFAIVLLWRIIAQHVTDEEGVTRLPILCEVLRDRAAGLDSERLYFRVVLASMWF